MLEVVRAVAMCRLRIAVVGIHHALREMHLLVSHRVATHHGLVLLIIRGALTHQNLVIEHLNLLVVASVVTLTSLLASVEVRRHHRVMLLVIATRSIRTHSILSLSSLDMLLIVAAVAVSHLLIVVVRSMHHSLLLLAARCVRNHHVLTIRSLNVVAIVVVMAVRRLLLLTWVALSRHILTVSSLDMLLVRRVALDMLTGMMILALHLGLLRVLVAIGVCRSRALGMGRLGIALGALLLAAAVTAVVLLAVILLVVLGLIGRRAELLGIREGKLEARRGGCSSSHDGCY